jgi:hypothetical protein
MDVGKLLKKNVITDIDLNSRMNLNDLCETLTLLEKIYGSDFTITSGFRTMADHKRIYKAKGIDNPPMGSKHLFGQAADLLDPNGDIMYFLKARPEVMTELGIWCEDGTKGWLHVQTIAPRSGKRWFLP